MRFALYDPETDKFVAAKEDNGGLIFAWKDFAPLWDENCFKTIFYQGKSLGNIHDFLYIFMAYKPDFASMVKDMDISKIYIVPINDEDLPQFEDIYR